MKTTLALLLAAGVASAGVQPIYHLSFDDTSHFLTSDVEGSGIEASANGYANYIAAVNNAPVYLGSGASYNMSPRNDQSITFTLNGAISYTSDFTVTFVTRLSDGTTSLSAAWRNLFQIGDGTNHLRLQNNGQNTEKTTLGMYGNGTLSADAAILNVDNTGLLAKGSVLTDDWSRVTLTYTYTEGTGGFFKLYMDGTLITQNANAFNADGTATGPTSMTLGSALNGSTIQYLYYDELGVYSTALTQEQITASLVGKTTGEIVPEPATATLSLLALAGLAARRRRK